MTFGIEFHDSRLLDLQCASNGEGFVLLRGCVYRSKGQVFQDAQESGSQDVKFHLSGMRIEGVVPKFGEYASEGDLWVNESNGNGTTSLPADHSGDICLELCLSPLFETIKIYASSVTSTFEGEFDLYAVWDADGNSISVA